MSVSEFVFGGIGARRPDKRPYIIAFANEKGGTGKSTLSFHAIVALLQRGYTVGSIDADARQGTLSRYLENRAATRQARVDLIAMPRHVRLGEKKEDDSDVIAPLPVEAARDAVLGLADCDFIVIDTPGSATRLTRFALANADTLISPVNDSYVDIDVIAALNMERREVVGPSQFTRLVWECSNKRVAEGLPPTDWVVLRNRLTHIDSRNKRDIADLMTKLANRIGFRVASGFGERVIYRELFHKGLTVMDVGEEPARSPTQSHRSAAQEMAGLLTAIGLPDDAGAAL
jgi:chromosome partitioning protein